MITYYLIIYRYHENDYSILLSSELDARMTSVTIVAEVGRSLPREHRKWWQPGGQIYHPPLVDKLIPSGLKIDAQGDRI